MRAVLSAGFGTGTRGRMSSGDEEEEEEEERTRVRRSAGDEGEENLPVLNTCPLLLVADYKFFRSMGQGLLSHTTTYLVGRCRGTPLDRRKNPFSKHFYRLFQSWSGPGGLKTPSKGPERWSETPCGIIIFFSSEKSTPYSYAVTRTQTCFGV